MPWRVLRSTQSFLINRCPNLPPVTGAKHWKTWCCASVNMNSSCKYKVSPYICPFLPISDNEASRIGWLSVIDSQHCGCVTERHPKLRTNVLWISSRCSLSTNRHSNVKRLSGLFLWCPYDVRAPWSVIDIDIPVVSPNHTQIWDPQLLSISQF